MTELYELTIYEAAELLRQRKISSVELTRAHLDRIRAIDDKVHAFTLVTDELALKPAREADRRFSNGATVSPLTGIPLAIKDVICTKDIPTTCGSRMLETFKPPFDATVMERLNAAGIVRRPTDRAQPPFPQLQRVCKLIEKRCPKLRRALRRRDQVIPGNRALIIAKNRRLNAQQPRLR